MKKQTTTLFTLLVMVAVAFPGSAQKKMSRYQKNLMYEADIYYTQGDYYYASELYGELVQVEPDNPLLLERLGICYFHLPPLRNQAEGYLEKAVKRDGTEAYYYLAKMRISDYRFYDALKLLDMYGTKADRMKSESQINHLKMSAQRAAEMVQSPLSVTVANLGKNVNSALHDYAPVWDINHGTIYFTSRRALDNKSRKDYSEQFDENIFEINLNSREVMARAAPLVFNSRTNDAAVACSPDGHRLILYRTNKDGFSGDLYMTERDGYAWSVPEKLSEQINSKYQEASACFDPADPDVLYFSSDRPEGFGGKDLYSVRRLPNGQWSEPKNLGAKINTAYDDDAPFVSADGVLYFASKGHTTMGGYDIFFAVGGAEGWEEPTNIGYPINTPGDDIFFTVDPEGSTAYFSSERIGGLGLQDLYRVSFDRNNTVIIRGQLSDDAEQIPDDATITLTNEDEGVIEGLYQTDPTKGTYVLALNTNRKYTMLVEAEGYVPVEKPLFFDGEINGVKEVEKNVVLSKIY